MKQVCRDQRKYYESLLVYSRQHLMLYPYHLSEFMIQGLRVTPFAYYHGMMKDIMAAEKSYDSLPNFTAADCEFWLVFYLLWVLLCGPLLIRWRFLSIFQYIAGECAQTVVLWGYVFCISYQFISDFQVCDFWGLDGISILISWMLQRPTESFL